MQTLAGRQFLRCVKRVGVLLILGCLPMVLIAQQPNPFSNLSVIRLTLEPWHPNVSANPIAPGSVRLLDTIAGVNVWVDSLGTGLHFSYPGVRDGDTVTVQFRTLPFSLEQRFSVRALRGAMSQNAGQLGQGGYSGKSGGLLAVDYPFTLKGYAQRQMALTEQTAAQSSGNIDLTLDGELPNRLRIHGELLSQNLPFQPEGTSLEVKALDRMYLRVGDSAWQVEGGDLQLTSPRGHFLSYSLPIQGVGYRFQGAVAGVDSLGVQVAGGVAKGQRQRARLTPQEGVQGPYRLQGERGFVQALVLAGSESVYIDGELLVRGEDYDYTIDYNLGEITFTARRAIVATMEIVVDYQMLQSSYTQYTAQGIVGVKLGNWNTKIHTILQHDAASSLQADGEAESIAQQLAALNPGEQGWLLPSRRTVDGMRDDGYQRVDTLVEGVRYAKFLYTPAGVVDSLYRVPFVYVGEGKGDYLLTQGDNNTQIFNWIAPVGNIHRGDYQAGRRVEPPQSSQRVQVDLGRDWAAGGARTELQTAYSRVDFNTVSQAKRQLAEGFALRVAHSQRLLGRSTGGLFTGGELSYASPKFNGVEDYRPVDYYTNWGITSRDAEGRWLDAVAWVAARQASGESRLTVGAIRGRGVQGYSLVLNQQYHWSRWALLTNVSARRTRLAGIPLRVGQANLELSRTLNRLVATTFARGKWLLRKGRVPGETTPYAWWQSGLRVSLADTLRHRALAELSYREDLPVDTVHSHRQRTLEFRANTQLQLPHQGSLLGVLTVRGIQQAGQLRYSSLQTAILSRIGYFQPLLSGRAVVAVDTDFGSERRPKWQLHYVQVPVGQGQYAWVDLNGDGIPQLSEFVRAQFPDQARWVLQRVPSSSSARVITHAARVRIQLSPRPGQVAINDSTPLWQRFDATLEGSMLRKRADAKWGRLLDPTASFRDSVLLEGMQQVGVSVMLNRDAEPLGLTYRFAYQQGGQTLAQGLSAQWRRAHTWELATPNRVGWGGGVEYALAHGSQSLPYMPEAALFAREQSWEVKVLWRGQLGQLYTLLAQWKGITIPAQPASASIKRVELSANRPLAARWEILCNLSYANLRSTLNSADPRSYTLQQGLAPGHNILLGATLRYRVTKYLQASLLYQMRSLGLDTPVHSGSVQLKAVF